MSPRHASSLGRRQRSRAPSLATRLRVIQAAAELIEKQGYERTSMAEIAQHAGIVKRTLSHCFADKRSILLELIDEWSKRLASDRRPLLPVEALTDGEPRAVVGTILRRTCELLQYRRWIHAEIFPLLRHDEEVRPRCQNVERAIAERFAAMIQLAQQCGVLRRDPDPLVDSLLLFSVLERLRSRMILVQRTPLESERVLEELTDLLCLYLVKDS